MTADNPRPRTPFRPASAAALVLLLALAGCKSKDGGGGLGIFSRGDSTKPRDPLVYGPNRIPPQNVPVNDRGGGVGAKGKTDPLIGSPTGKSGDKTGVGYSDDPERFKGVFVPSEKSTPASLAARSKGGDELKIDDRPDRGRDDRVPLQPAGGAMPADPGAGRGDGGRVEVPGGGLDGLYAELKTLGVKPEDRSLGREDGRYVFRASVPWQGAKRQYTAYGDTEAEAVKKLIEYVMADRK